MTRLLALAGLEDRFLVHKRRVLGLVAERRVTASDILEVLGLRPSKEFSEAVARGVRRVLEEQRVRRGELEARAERGRGAGGQFVHFILATRLKLADEVAALVEQVQVGKRTLANWT